MSRRGRGGWSVRIAVSGTHRAGKSTLIGDLAGQLRGYRVVDEPYHLLEDEGFEFSDPPSLEDWVEQLRRSLEELEGDASRNLILDRCPLDLVAYAQAHADGDALELEEWMPRIREVMETLDLVVFVPLEHPDRIPVGDGEDPGLRTSVDRELAAMLEEDSLGLGLEVLTVSGSRKERLAQVLRRIT
jgi:predicted ATPase